MSDYAVIANVGESLRQILAEHIDADSVFSGHISSSDIALQSPDTDHGGNTAKLTIYLYRAVENPFLKNRHVQSSDPVNTRDFPLALDLFYLITPDTGNPSMDHLIMGKVMQVFHDHPLLQGSHLLGGALAGSDTRLRLVFHSLPFEEIIQLWQSFSEKSFRFSACYRVTPVLIDGTELNAVVRNTVKNDRWSQKNA